MTTPDGNTHGPKYPRPNLPGSIALWKFGYLGPWVFSTIANPRRFPLNPPQMATVAEQLRTAREARKLTVHQIADITKIRTDHIRALEEGNFDLFVAPVYIRGFVRTYAGVLKLDVPQVMAALVEELSRTEKFAEPPRLSAQPRGVLDFVTLQFSKVNWRIASVVLAVLTGVALLVLIALAVRNYKTRDPLKGLPPAVYHSPGGDKLPLTNAPARPR